MDDCIVPRKPVPRDWTAASTKIGYLATERGQRSCDPCARPTWGQLRMTRADGRRRERGPESANVPVAVRSHGAQQRMIDARPPARRHVRPPPLISLIARHHHPIHLNTTRLT